MFTKLALNTMPYTEYLTGLTAPVRKIVEQREGLLTLLQPLVKYVAHGGRYTIQTQWFESATPPSKQAPDATWPGAFGGDRRVSFQDTTRERHPALNEFIGLHTFANQVPTEIVLMVLETVFKVQDPTTFLKPNGTPDYNKIDDKYAVHFPVRGMSGLFPSLISLNMDDWRVVQRAFANGAYRKYLKLPQAA